MQSQEKNQNYYKLFPLIMYFFSIITRNFQTSSTAIYFSMVFYWSLTIYYIVSKQFSFSTLVENLKSGKKFWLPVTYTFFAMLIAYAVSYIPNILNPSLNNGLSAYRISSGLSVMLFAITLIPLPSVVEECFFRQGIISFASHKTVFITSCLGLILFGLSHTSNPLGMSMAILWGVPLTICYTKTRNLYIPVVTHFITNLLMNGFTVISVILYLMK